MDKRRRCNILQSNFAKFIVYLLFIFTLLFQGRHVLKCKDNIIECPSLVTHSISNYHFSLNDINMETEFFLPSQKIIDNLNEPNQMCNNAVSPFNFLHHTLQLYIIVKECKKEMKVRGVIIKALQVLRVYWPL